MEPRAASSAAQTMHRRKPSDTTVKTKKINQIISIPKPKMAPMTQRSLKTDYTSERRTILQLNNTASNLCSLQELASPGNRMNK